MRGIIPFGVLALLALGSAARASDVEVEGAAPPGVPAAETGAAADAVVRAVFTTEVVDREPGEALGALPSGVSRIHFFTELRGLEGRTVVHRWERDGEVRAEVPFEVGGPRWRVWSSKELAPDAGGVWTVSVLDGDGNLLASRSLAAPPAVPVE